MGLFPFCIMNSERNLKGDRLTTAEYIRRFDPVLYETRGTDPGNFDVADSVFESPAKTSGGRESPSYDFHKLRLVERVLAHVDRERALKAILAAVTAGAETDQARHLRLLRFLQKSHYHGYFSPVYPHGACVTDPLVLLELGDMWCADVARVAIDLWGSAGKPGRLVQLGGHQIAELHYGGRWHYFDAAIFDGGAAVFDDEGNIPSIVELSQPENRIKVDRFRMYNRPFDVARGAKKCRYYASYFYFSRRAYTTPAQYYVKEAAAEGHGQVPGSRYQMRTVQDGERMLYDQAAQSEPSAVDLIEVACDSKRGNLQVNFSRSTDPDNDLLGYRVFCSHVSRGWDYSHFYGTESAKKYRSITCGWKSQMYERMQMVPPHEVTLIETRDLCVDIQVQRGKTYFITVMPVGSWGQRVGREIYAMSNEIRVDVK